MSFIVTGDLQAEWSNLDLCEKAWAEVLHICTKRKLKTIVFCGDGKEAYDPVSIRVIKFWQWAIRRAKRMDIRVIYLLGNHDRIATYSEAGDWLSIIRRAGAITFSSPGIVNDGDRRLFMLPYAKVKVVKQWALKLLKHDPDKSKDVLFFHQNLLEARYSQHGQQSDSSLSVSDLFSDRYFACIGGDIHLPQKVENTYYVGSPFCFDWGEVNQRKRYLVVGGSKIQSVHSRIPRWFDPSVNGFESSQPRTWNGARIRIVVQCDAHTDYERAIEKARRHAQKSYPGAELFVVPKFADERREDTGISTSETDEHKIKQYLRSSKCSSALQKLALEYMLEKLSHFGHGLRTGSRFKFLWAKAKNYLSFEKVKFDFRQRGIVVIRGVNQDRDNKSNGSGKTSLTNLIPVAWFGRTFKGQAHNRWSNRFHPKEQAYVEICGRDVKNRKIQVMRGRRPTELKLLVNGHNESAGMKSTDSTGTQAHVEQVTGFTWDTLANAVYIDRSICDAFLSGTKAQRTEVLSRFQNLERFTKALKLVKKEAKENDDRYHIVKEQLSSVRGSIEERKQSLHELEKVHKTQVGMLRQGYDQHKRNYKRWKKVQKPLLAIARLNAKDLDKKYDQLWNELQKMERDYAILDDATNTAQAWVKKWRHLKSKSYCPTCYQDLTRKTMHYHTEKAKHGFHRAEQKAKSKSKELVKLRRELDRVNDKREDTATRVSRFCEDERHLRDDVHNAHKQFRELTNHQHSVQLIEKTKDKLVSLHYLKNKLKQRKEKFRGREKLYEYAMQAFSRDGIPAFLNRALCPVLNRASDYYSELFSNKEIQVRFKVEDGEFVPQIINAKGGEGIKDQSEGERALAGLISSFALREAAPEC